MYHTTGFSKSDIVELCVLVNTECGGLVGRVWPPILGLHKAVTITLAYLRRNRVQAELAEAFGVSQPTISRSITALTPILGRVLADYVLADYVPVDYVPVAEDLDPKGHYIVDGALLPCWSRASLPGLYSGKHKTTGMNVQVACDLSGRLSWISDPLEGRRHDTAALRLTGVLDTLDTQKWLGDKGYIGNDMITPFRKPAHRKLLDWEKQFNTAVNQLRYKIERTIANVKTWRILHTDYRRPFETFTETIATVIALHFYKLTCE